MICIHALIEYIIFLYMTKNKKNNDSYIICIGTVKKFTTSVVVCNGKVITVEIGQLVFSAVLVLLAVHYT